MRAHSEHRWLFPTVGRLFFVLILVSACATQAHALFPHHENAHKEIEGLELDWRQAQLSNNISEVDRLLADDYLGISANGTLETKADELTRRRSGTLHITQLDLSDIKVRIYGDTAVVTSKADLVGKNGDRDISGRFRYTRVYSNRMGQWRIVSFEASRISPQPRIGRPALRQLPETQSPDGWPNKTSCSLRIRVRSERWKPGCILNSAVPAGLILSQSTQD